MPVIGNDVNYTITYASLCTGISCESIALTKPYSDLNWQPLFFAEIDKFCCELLKVRYPHVRNYKDINNVKNRQITERPKVIIGGTPCQSFSINGQRKGLDDARGNLSLVFMQIVQKLMPTWVIWENVPNCLEIDEGRAFRDITSALENCGYGWAYRIFDLRSFGYPQSRKRLFLVGYRGSYKVAFMSLVESSEEKQFSSNTKSEKEICLDGIKIGDRVPLDGWNDDSTPKRLSNYSLTLKSNQGRNGCGVIYNGYKGMVRKYSIKEMERLQGIPDDYTKIIIRGKIPSYTCRVKAIGNAFPPPIVKWIGTRIDFLDKLLSI